MGLQRERPFVAVLQQRADLAEVIELAGADRGPYDLAVLVLVVAQVDVEDARGVELAVAIGERLLAGFGGIIRVPRDADVVSP